MRRRRRRRRTRRRVNHRHPELACGFRSACCAPQQMLQAWRGFAFLNAAGTLRRDFLRRGFQREFCSSVGRGGLLTVDCCRRQSRGTVDC